MMSIKINAYRVKTSLNSLLNVVVTVDASLTKTIIVDGLEKEITINKIFNLDTPKESSFIDISSLSIDTITEWLNNNIKKNQTEIEEAFLKSYSFPREQQTLEKLESLVENYKNIIIKIELQINELKQQLNQP
jgi:hypothetical protein